MDNVKSLLVNTGINKQLVMDLIHTQCIRKHWNKIVGDVLFSQLRCDFIKKNVCTLSVSNPCWFSEFYIYESTILKNINEHLPKHSYIKKIRLQMDVNKRGNKKREYLFKKNYDSMIGR